jgi:hypothetical protein
MYIDVTFWCKSDTDEDYPGFNATFIDTNEYFTTQFAFRKVSARLLLSHGWLPLATVLMLMAVVLFRAADGAADGSDGP